MAKKVKIEWGETEELVKAILDKDNERVWQEYQKLVDKEGYQYAWDFVHALFKLLVLLGYDVNVCQLPLNPFIIRFIS